MLAWMIGFLIASFLLYIIVVNTTDSEELKIICEGLLMFVSFMTVMCFISFTGLLQ